MSYDYTQQQSTNELKHSRELSQSRSAPPLQVSGYDIQQFLGSGAYGEVWVGVNRTTGRRVAIKFYTHRGGVDWSLLSREVEKLVFLSADRYVVQLLDVGWDADPPYYVMDYIENGSLEDLLNERGCLPLADALELFREVSVGLMHLHGKGVLHCDLKPANVLLDADHKPRLADFGQSRLSHEQSPALGTLFYMAPEQADLEALPDARWDVYALGALLYCMLVGEAPRRSDDTIGKIESATDMGDRLARYREAMRSGKGPSKHRKVPGIDRHLVDIIDRCLAVNQEQRFASVQSVIEALAARDRARMRRPLQVLGVVGPLLLLLVMGLFGWRGYTQAVSESRAEVERRARESNDFAAQFAAKQVAVEIDRYFRAVEQVVQDDQFRDAFRETTESPALSDLLAQLQDPNDNSPPVQEVRTQFVNHLDRQRLQALTASLLDDQRFPEAASWFVCDAAGMQIAASFRDDPTTKTIGKNYAWRTYFHGEDDDLREASMVDGEKTSRYLLPPPGKHIERTHLSAAFQSTATGTWKVAVSTPIFVDGQFQGLVALTVEIGNFMQFQRTEKQFAVLVDGRPGENQGVILQHPLYDEILQRYEQLPPRLGPERRYRVDLDDPALGKQQEEGTTLLYTDVLGGDEEGQAYNQKWIAVKSPVLLERGRAYDHGRRELVVTGLAVVVQESYAPAIAPIRDLSWRLLRLAGVAILAVVLVVGGLWYLVVRMLREPQALPLASPRVPSAPTRLSSLPTVPVTVRERKEE